MDRLELFFSTAGGVISWQTPGLIGHKELMNAIDQPFRSCLDSNNQGTFAAFNHKIHDEHYVSVACAVLGNDNIGTPRPAAYRFHAILPWAIYQEQLNTNPFELVRWAFDKEVLSRIYGNTKSETKAELFSPQVYEKFPPQIEKRRPNVTFMRQYWNERQLKLFIGALIAGVDISLRFRDDGNVTQWAPNQDWKDRKPTDGERLLEELYLCLPDETRAWCNISTAWNHRCDQFPFHLALDSSSPDNAQTVLNSVINVMTEEDRSKAQVEVERYVTPLFKAIADNDDEHINQLHREFTINNCPSEQNTDDGESSVTDHNNRLQTMAKHPFVISTIGIALIVGFGIFNLLLFFNLGENQKKLIENYEKLIENREKYFQIELKKTNTKLQKTKQEKISLEGKLDEKKNEVKSLNDQINTLKKNQSLDKKPSQDANNQTGDGKLPKVCSEENTQCKSDLEKCQNEKNNLHQSIFEFLKNLLTHYDKGTPGRKNSCPNE